MYQWAKEGAQPLDWNGHDRIELPLKPDHAGRPTFPVRVMGHDTVALFDSGMEIPVVDRDLLPDSIANSLVNAKVNGKRRETVRNVALQIGPASMELYSATVVDDPSHGPFVIGADVLLQAVVELDFQAGIVTISRPEAFVPPVDVPTSIKVSRALPTVKLQLNAQNQQICALIDTGFNGQLAVTPKVVEDFKLPADPAGGVWRAVGAFGERTERPALAPLREVRVGNLLFPDVRVGHAPRSDECGNLVGMGILYRNRVIFDLKNDRIWLIPQRPELQQ